jgi:GH24 family phage-related lysozyme (muramidase)
LDKVKNGIAIADGIADKVKDVSGMVGQVANSLGLKGVANAANKVGQIAGDVSQVGGAVSGVIDTVGKDIGAVGQAIHDPNGNLAQTAATIANDVGDVSQAVGGVSSAVGQLAGDAGWSAGANAAQVVTGVADQVANVAHDVGNTAASFENAGGQPVPAAPAGVPQAPPADPAGVPQAPPADPAGVPQAPSADPAGVPQAPPADPAGVPQAPSADPAGVPQAPPAAGGDDAQQGQGSHGSYDANGVPEPALNIIKSFEGLTLKAVPDDRTGNLPITIGYGSTEKPDGSPWHMGDTITAEQAHELLSIEVARNYMPPLVRSIPTWNQMNENQQSAIISFGYNLGPHFYGHPKFATITRALSNVNNFSQVPAALRLYINPGSNVSRGLLRRRIAEGALFSS